MLLRQTLRGQLCFVQQKLPEKHDQQLHEQLQQQRLQQQRQRQRGQLLP